MRILIAEDDEALAKFVRQGLEGEHYAVDVFVDGEQARAAATENDYDIVILDLNLPKLDGVSVLRHLRLKKPSLPVLVLTQRTRVEDKVQCLDTGADDYVPKQMAANSLDILHIRDDLIAKIHAAAQSHKSRAREPHKKPSQPYRSIHHDPPRVAPGVIAVGASTGGPKALQEILPLLPRELSAPILIVQHMPPGFTAPFAQRLNSLCALTVQEAIDDEEIMPGVAYIAPAGMQMVVRRLGSKAFIELEEGTQNQLHTPSVNVMMKSVAKHFGNFAMGVILTGMGTDGAEGMDAIRKQGGLTVGQDEGTCTVYGMPRACAELGALARVVPLLQIPTEILEATRCRKRA
jgi:two-component system, chemotaxis family, protein-glutamate methylesterase/glutaminase